MGLLYRVRLSSHYGGTHIHGLIMSYTEATNRIRQTTAHVINARMGCSYESCSASPSMRKPNSSGSTTYFGKPTQVHKEPFAPDLAIGVLAANLKE